MSDIRLPAYPLVDFSVSRIQSTDIRMKVLPESILRFDTLPSTNTEAVRRAMEGAAEGLCIVASEQTSGRGRLQRKWVSPKGSGLYFSIVLRPRIKEHDWPLITLMTALAVYDALLDACNLKTDIKWPNDILANDRKLCGILAEAVETKLGRAVVVGIGVNLNSAGLPTELGETATSVELATGKPPDPEAVLQALLRALERRYESLHSLGGWEETIREWSMHSSYANGKRIQVRNGDELLKGTTRGLESDGALRVETDAGEIKVVRAGDVTVVRGLEN
jgi:BirA family transcriptional regulator, biotin operon repressor / biotin---[acetyl-CoA-carboxylase] ligase